MVAVVRVAHGRVHRDVGLQRVGEPQIGPGSAHCHGSSDESTVGSCSARRRGMGAMSRSRDELEAEAWFRDRYGRGSSDAARVLEQR